MPEQYFTIKPHRPYNPTTTPMLPVDRYREPAEAADAAEEWLTMHGKANQSFVDIYFNGDGQPFYSIFLLGYKHYGVWNREGIPWPLDYMVGDSHGPTDKRLESHPRNYAEGEDDEIPIIKDEGKAKEDDDATTMQLGRDEDDSQDDDGEDEEWDGDDGEEPENAPEDVPEGDDEDDDQGEDEDEAKEDEQDEEGEDEEDENEGEEGEDKNDDDESKDDQPEPDQEPEMPRLTIFAKMRGPKGWRKRAEIEDLNERNVFGFKVGVLDKDGETPGTQEYNVRAEIQFIENNDRRKDGTLRIKLPEGVTLDDFKVNENSGWMTVGIPYYDQD